MEPIPTNFYPSTERVRLSILLRFRTLRVFLDGQSGQKTAKKRAVFSGFLGLFNWGRFCDQKNGFAKTCARRGLPGKKFSGYRRGDPAPDFDPGRKFFPKILKNKSRPKIGGSRKSAQKRVFSPKNRRSPGAKNAKPTFSAFLRPKKRGPGPKTGVRGGADGKFRFPPSI